MRGLFESIFEISLRWDGLLGGFRVCVGTDGQSLSG